jgi:hypothetical protein
MCSVCRVLHRIWVDGTDFAYGAPRQELRLTDQPGATENKPSTSSLRGRRWKKAAGHLASTLAVTPHSRSALPSHRTASCGYQAQTTDRGKIRHGMNFVNHYRPMSIWRAW